ncbi:MAG: rRNA maturation RNase YbeY [Oscillospiraceae bacterium]|nr:rRNA maturation RNase YbeY [Oscillospiraceae bacterium]
MSEEAKLKHNITTKCLGGASVGTAQRSLMKQAVLMTIKTEYVDMPCVVNILITDDDGIKTYNSKYRGINKATDVLSFPMQTFKEAGWRGVTDIDIDMDTQTVPLGDIIISMATIRRQARFYEHSIDHESVRMIIHSALHLLGYDHNNEENEKIMEEKEVALIELMGYFKS